MKKIYVGKSKICTVGVFADEDISPNERIIEYTGNILSYEDSCGQQENYTVQISANEYMGPSGKEDDLVNHSCSPNAGLKRIKNEIWLVATKWILKDEEITFDYSTTIGPNEEWTMQCNCGSMGCRKIIGKFNMLPQELQEHYRILGIAMADKW
jgi:SET domain-containing protein